MPPVSTTVSRGSPARCSTSAAGSEFVTTVSGRMSLVATCWASRCVVVPADRAIALPGRTRSSAARAMAAFSAAGDLELGEEPWLVRRVPGVDGAAVHLAHQSGAGELGDVATDRHVRDVELGHELGDPRRAAVLHAAEDQLPALGR